MAEVALATYEQQLSLKRGNEIVCALVDKYETKFANPDIGKPYHEVYDVVTAKPLPWWLELYNDTKREMAKEFDLRL